MNKRKSLSALLLGLGLAIGSQVAVAGRPAVDCNIIEAECKARYGNWTSDYIDCVLAKRCAP